jgi:HlyD family secretion protein
LLKPGMTATSTITVAHKANVLLVPNAALRFNPTAKTNGAPRTLPLGPPRSNSGSQSANFGRGARRQIWTLDPKHNPQALIVTTGDTDGSLTEVSGPGVVPGIKVITGQLSAAAKP